MSTILLIQDRKNNYHIADYISIHGHKYTACGLVYLKKEIINTFSLDAAIPIFCKTCYNFFKRIDEENHKDMDNCKYNNLIQKYRITQMMLSGKAFRYEKYTNRYWPKLSRFKAYLGSKK